MGDNACELGAHGDREGFFAFVELAALLCWMTNTPTTRRWWMIGAPRKEAKRSSPVSAK